MLRFNITEAAVGGICFFFCFFIIYLFILYMPYEKSKGHRLLKFTEHRVGSMFRIVSMVRASRWTHGFVDLVGSMVSCTGWVQWLNAQSWFHGSMHRIDSMAPCTELIPGLYAQCWFHGFMHPVGSMALCLWLDPWFHPLS